MWRKTAVCMLLATAANAFHTPGFANTASTMARSVRRPNAMIAARMSTLHEFSATTLAGEDKSLGDYKGKPVLVLNVASLCGTTVKDFNDMNALADQFGDKLAILAFPCNQFSHQTNEGDEEFLNTLKHVRPGGGFEPKCEIFKKTNVNGATAAPLFKWLKSCIKIPNADADGDTKENGCDDVDALILPRGGFDTTTVTLWSPVSRTDIAWNFEKFLIDAEGKLIKRYSRYFSTADIAADVEALLEAPVAA